MNKHLARLLICTLWLLPALAQANPLDTNLDPEAARLEARNTRDHEQPALSPEQALANALQRCARLPPFYRVDCETRVRGQVQGTGSVRGGGLLKETRTLMPEHELQEQLRVIEPVAPATFTPPAPPPPKN